MSLPTKVLRSASVPASWSAFGRLAFVVLWGATVISSIGTWMNDVGSGWLMTTVAPDPLTVALVQTATWAPIFLFALLAGAAVDIIDRRKLLIFVNSLTAVTAAVLAALVTLERMSAGLLLLFTFLLGTGAAFIAPAWQAIVAHLAPKRELGAAIALNAMGINISRAIGPALAGVLVVALGLAPPFALNAFSFIAIVAALAWWRPASATTSLLPAEHIGEAIINGLRYTVHSTPLRATLLRAVAFFSVCQCVLGPVAGNRKDNAAGGRPFIRHASGLCRCGSGNRGHGIVHNKASPGCRPHRGSWIHGHSPRTVCACTERQHLCCCRWVTGGGPFLAIRSLEPEYFDKNGAAGLGACARVVSSPDGILRCHGSRRGRLGQDRIRIRHTERVVDRSKRGASGYSVDLARKTRAGRGARSCSLYALVTACRNRGHIT
jgi:hypothetical protein